MLHLSKIDLKDKDIAMAKKHLLDDYRRMMERVKESLAQKHTLQEAIKKAKEEAVALKELTEDEAHKVAAYLERDLTDLIGFVQKEEGVFKDWLAIDELYIEDQLLQLFKTVADPTYIEQVKLKEELAKRAIYQAGEIAGIGTLYCTQCHHRVPFETINEIAVCPECGNREFKRG